MINSLTHSSLCLSLSPDLMCPYSLILSGSATTRLVKVTYQVEGKAYVAIVGGEGLDEILEVVDLEGVQPLLTPDDCLLAEEIVKSDQKVKAMLVERFGITNLASHLACDPWSVHCTGQESFDTSKVCFGCFILSHLSMIF